MCQVSSIWSLCMNGLPFPLIRRNGSVCFWDAFVGGMLRGLAQVSLMLLCAPVSLMLVVPLSSS